MSAAARLGLVLAFLGGLGGCGGEAGDGDMALLAWFRWNDAPASPAQIGYEVRVDVGWPSRSQTCFALSPNLRVTVNDRAAETDGVVGECMWDVVFRAGPFTMDEPVEIRVLDGERSLGEARFDGAFAGAGAKLVSPESGTVAPGGELTISVPTGLPVMLPAAEFYWRDPPPGVPTFRSWVPAQLAPDGFSVKTTAPAVPGLSGRAALVIELADFPPPAASSCTGFVSCSSLVEGRLGPVDVVVQ
jgi:hypothetical protein